MGEPDYENPTLGQRANADQQIAATRNMLARIIVRIRRGDLEEGHDRIISIGLAIADEIAELDDEDQMPAAMAMAAIAANVIANKMDEEAMVG